jgi:hypothetical protein
MVRPTAEGVFDWLASMPFGVRACVDAGAGHVF